MFEICQIGVGGSACRNLLEDQKVVDSKSVWTSQYGVLGTWTGSFAPTRCPLERDPHFAPWHIEGKPHTQKTSYILL